ncbi:MAG: helix-turn-helix domain-containing protein, partial [Myxococcota bacterium]
LPATALKWPLQALRNRVVPLDALMDNAPRGLEEGWERCNASPFMDELAATTTLLQHAPNTSITELAAHVGWSDRTLRRRFTQGLGLPPKTFAQIQRLQWVVHHLRQEPHSALASLALKCGYADQAHLSNDVRRFTGLTPTKLRRLVADSFKIHPPTSPYPHR